MHPLIVIVGPTGSGKTGLAIEIAKRLKSGVISADSRQVYRGLDIGTEKVSKYAMRGVPHHCIDIVSPRRAISVETWRKHAERAIRHLHNAGTIPVVAGGTGLYIDALVYGVDFPAVKPNPILRRELEKKSAQVLLEHLRSLDPIRTETIEQQNPRRLIRAIEIATILGSVPPLRDRIAQYEVTWIGLNPPFMELEEHIALRIDKALKKGLLAETKKIKEEIGLSWKRINELGLEYRIVGEYLRDELPHTALRDTLVREVRRYAKRQLAWLKQNKDIVWYPSPEDALRSFV